MISFALALIMVLVLVACGDNPASNGGNTQNETVTLRASTPTAPEHPWSKCLDNIAAQIKEKTNGRYQIDVYYNASLSENSEKTMTEQIMTGTLDLGISPAPLVGKAFSAFSFPFQFDDRDHIKRVCDSAIRQRNCWLLPNPMACIPWPMWKMGSARSPTISMQLKPLTI